MKQGLKVHAKSSGIPNRENRSFRTEESLLDSSFYARNDAKDTQYSVAGMTAGALTCLALPGNVSEIDRSLLLSA